MEYEYINDYKGYSIFQDMDNGYYVAYDDLDNVIAYEATMAMIEKEINCKLL